ncbi:MAG: sugar phosphate isomerase/epimerase family protein [Anaerolineae bacterium]
MAAMQLGVVTSVTEGPEQALANVRGMGFPTCQLASWHDERSHSLVERVLRAAETHQVELTTVWVEMPGRHVWDFLEGPNTIGLVPPETRDIRIAALREGSNLARRLGVPSITTHVGFIPENPSAPQYAEIVSALRAVATHCAENGQEFWFETGQETPITLRRTIEDVGTGNLGVNLDPANLLMYGKANPLDALDILGDYVRGVHAKDGEYPTDGWRLGVEKPLGEGRVDFPRLLARLAALGYAGALTIEREISGPQQVEDILKAKQILEDLIDRLGSEA